MRAQELPDTRVLPSQQGPLPPEPPAPAESPPILPPAPIPIDAGDGPRIGGLSIAVDRITLEGNSVLPEAELARAVQVFEGRRLTSQDLLDLRRTLTRAYVEAGYTTSFATIPDQDPGSGSLVVQIVEGRLIDLEIEGTTHLRPSYVTQRVAPRLGEPLNVIDLEKRLQVLQRDPRIESIAAELSPGRRPGESVLALRVVEARRWRAQATVANDRAASIGGVNGRVGGGFANATGLGDDTAVVGAFSSGLSEIVAETSIPVTRFDTRLGASGRFSAAEVVNGAFTDLDIESRFWSFGAGLSQPLYRSRSLDWSADLVWELRESSNTAAGAPFSTSDAARGGRLRASVLRLSTSFAVRDMKQVIAARTMVSIGLPVAGAWTTDDGVDDSKFAAWLVQLQWARRLPWLDIEVLSRFDGQLAFDPLPPFERFAIGGTYSVRGLPENRLVRDNGFAASLEVRIPVLQWADGRSMLAFAPFVDAGRAWFHDRGPSPSPTTLAGAGIGLLANPMPGVSSYLYWGADLTGVEDIGSRAQDKGIHFGLTLRSW